MTRALIVAVSLGLSLSAASACEYMRSAKAKVDQTVVASITPEEQPMSTSQQAILLDEAAKQKAAEELAQ